MNNKYWSYFKYIITHKWYVWKECKKYKLYWQGITHDLSKFRLDEFIPYARFFYDDNGNLKQKRDESGYYKPTDTGDINFDMAWALHCKRNKHHWQFWTTPNDYEGLKIFNIPEKYIMEMICDWKGAAKAQGIENPNITKWYKLNRVKMQLSSKSAKMIAEYLGYMKK